MKMKMSGVLTAMMLFAAVAAYAQPQGRGDRPQMSPEQRAEMMAGRMKTELNLTDTQADAVKNLYLSRQSQARPQDPEARAKMREEQRAEMKKILTAEQFTKWEEMQAQMRRGPGPQMPPEGRQGTADGRNKADVKREGRRAPGDMAERRIEQMKRELELTDSQVEALQALHKDASAERQKNAEKREVEAAAHREQMKSILTEEQYAKFLEMERKRPEAGERPGGNRRPR